MKADRCRGCRSTRLLTLHDFGSQPLAGYYPTRPESAQHASRYPLDLTQCTHCGLLQVVNLPPIGEVFHDDYRYSSSTVPGLVAHFAEYALWVQRHLAAGGNVFEFGCNDGVLLERLRAMGIACRGIDASDNVASLARSKGLQVDTGYLTESYVHDAGVTQRYDFVTCSNVFAHIHELHDTLAAVRALLKPDGLFCIEVHNGEVLSSENQFDTIYHEHLSYFTEQTLRSLLERNGFSFVLCERTAMHGGGLRCMVRKAAPAPAAAMSAPAAAVPLMSRDVIVRAIERCRDQLHELHRQHGPLVGYGAAGRSQMFINFTNSAQLFRRVYDDSPFRQGRYIAGTDIPIEPFQGEAASCVIVLAWNYAADISRKIRGAAGRIVTLLPELRVW
jgi:SAM-dependent methyltransferase